MLKTQQPPSYSPVDVHHSYNPADYHLPEYQTKAGVGLAPTTTHMPDPDAEFPKLDPEGLDTRKVKSIDNREAPVLLFGVGAAFALTSCILAVVMATTALYILLPVVALGLGGATIWFAAACIATHVQYRDLLNMFKTKVKNDKASTALEQLPAVTAGSEKRAEVAALSHNQHSHELPPPAYSGSPTVYHGKPPAYSP